jgi:tetratricopeptide (TPR) repeat protein
MKFLASAAALALALLTLARGQEPAAAPMKTPLELQVEDQSLQESSGAEKMLLPGSGPKVDAKRIINDSYSFLKEREPEMTEEEDALYQRVVLLVPTQPDFAMQLLENMMNGDQPASPAFDFALANLYFNNGRREDAEAHYRTAIKKYPTFLRAWTNLGILLYTAQRYPAAAEALSKAISLGDHDAGTLGLMGYCLAREGDPVAAEMAYLQALALAPENPDWIEGLVTIYQDGKQYARAEPLARRLIQLKPKDTANWLLYANLLVVQDRKVEAAAVLETAASMNALDEDGLLQLGDLYAEQRFYKEATDEYEKAMAQNPKLGDRHAAAYAQGLIAEGRLDQAGQILQAMGTNLPPELRGVWLEARIDLLVAGANWPEAQRAIAELLALDPLNGNALLRLGKVYRSKGDLPRSTFAFEQAYRLPGFTYAACLELSNLSLQSHNFDKSIQYIEKALSLQKSSDLQDYLIKLKTLAPDHDNNPQSQ